MYAYIEINNVDYFVYSPSVELLLSVWYNKCLKNSSELTWSNVSWINVKKIETYLLAWKYSKLQLNIHPVLLKSRHWSSVDFIYLFF